MFIILFSINRAICINFSRKPPIFIFNSPQYCTISATQIIYMASKYFIINKKHPIAECF